jgi:hypothetical protein
MLSSAGIVALLASRRLGPLPPALPVDLAAGINRETLAQGGPAPG